MRDITISSPEKEVLVAGNIVTMSLVPVVRQASMIFSGYERLVATVVSTVLAIFALLMLLGRTAAKRKRTQTTRASQLAGALRGGIL